MFENMNAQTMVSVLDNYFLKKLSCLKNNSPPMDGIGRMILQTRKDLILNAKEACLSYRQFEKDLSS